MDRVVIIQSNYIPWKGYFDMLAQADAVVLLDSVQSTKNDWRNRNQIKTAAGKQWLTIPVLHSTGLRIRDVQVASSTWSMKHFRTLSMAYAKAPHAAELLPRLRDWYDEAGDMVNLSQINRVFLRRIAGFLGVTSHFLDVEEILDDATSDRLDSSQRLVEICSRVGATSYISGPAARNYLNVELFDTSSIAVEWFDYEGFPAYPQLHGAFDHAVSILDLLLMTGHAAPQFALRDPRFKSGIH